MLVSTLPMHHTDRAQCRPTLLAQPVRMVEERPIGGVWGQTCPLPALQ